MSTWESPKEQIFEMPTGGAAIMRKGPNLLKFARKEQALALTTQLRTKFKMTPCFYRWVCVVRACGEARGERESAWECSCVFVRANTHTHALPLPTSQLCVSACLVVACV